VRVKGPGPDELIILAAEPGRSESSALAVWLRATRLKRLFRQGWLKRGIDEAHCESVADHSFGVALLALLLAPKREGVDRERAVLMALVHELGEAYAGDITPVDGVTKDEKRRLEGESLARVLEGSPERGFILDLWEEYEANASATARFVKELDRLEMGFEASVHAAEGSQRMGEFHDSARLAVKSPELSELLEAAIRGDGHSRSQNPPPCNI
jgi:putative hydrolase of HD superfamily